MSDREAFEKWAQDNGVRYQSKYDTGEYYFGDADLAWKAWQAAQAQAVNQQLLESLVDLLKAARGGIKLDAPELSIGFIDAAIHAIEAAQQRHGAGDQQ